MRNQNKIKATSLYIISILLPVLYIFWGWDLADYLEALGIASLKIYYIFFLIILSAISFIWSIFYGYLWENFQKRDYSFAIIGSPGWVLNCFLTPLKMSVRLYSGFITAIFVIAGIRIGVMIKKRLKITSKFSEPKERAAD
jgi:hypothetical protein